MSHTDIPPDLAPFRRNAWFPITAPEEGEPAGSRYGGRPWVANGASWPACPNCQRPMQLFLQLNTDDLPQPLQAEYGAQGLVQMFYCTETEPLCEVECEAFFPFSKSQLARVVAPQDGDVATTEGPEDAFPARAITGWRKLADYPNWEELDELGQAVTDDVEEFLEQEAVPRGGDKVGGWPAWVQAVEYPACPECGSRMRLLAQIDSEDHLPYMFGDVGCAHLTYCPEHPTRLAFGWACC